MKMPVHYNFFHVGMDDTDSIEGMCTTFLCYTAVKRLLLDGKTHLVDYPHLIRLNPNIPWKTRGNAALSLQLKTLLSKEEVFDFFAKIVKEFATSPRANSGLVLREGPVIPKEVEDFSRLALFSVMSLREARNLTDRFGMKRLELRSGQGLVGALASIGNLLRSDHTFELIAYRRNLRLRRSIELAKILRMSEATFPETFSNYDEKFGRVMIMPHGPDPVLCGIRGENPKGVLSAFRDLLPIQNLLGYMIFRSNQGTGEHLAHELDLKNANPYSSGKVTGTVLSNPEMEIGGHVFFKLGNGDGEISCACYEPTADFRKAVGSLTSGDLIEVAGGIRKPTSLHAKVLNLELLRPLKLRTLVSLLNPLCPSCRITLKSQGKNQGLTCKRCGYSIKGVKKVSVQKKRNVSTKLYMPPIKAHRHLTKPLHRYEIAGKKFEIPVKLISRWMS
jgi:tRNA(Ile2)-agmatinylcytidine synthase